MESCAFFVIVLVTPFLIRQRLFRVADLGAGLLGCGPPRNVGSADCVVVVDPVPVVAALYRLSSWSLSRHTLKYMVKMETYLIRLLGDVIHVADADIGIQRPPMPFSVQTSYVFGSVVFTVKFCRNVLRRTRSLQAVDVLIAQVYCCVGCTTKIDQLINRGNQIPNTFLQIHFLYVGVCINA